MPFVKVLDTFPLVRRVTLPNLVIHFIIQGCTFFGKEDVSSAQLNLRGRRREDIFKLRPKHEVY